MINFHTEITINRPVDQVFRFAVDPNNYPKWMEGVTSATAISSSPLGVGSQIRVVGRSPFGKYDTSLEITTYERNRRVGFKGPIPGIMIFDGGLDFEPKENSTTKVVSSGKVRLQGMWRLIEPLMAGEVRNGEAKELEKIKAFAESGG